MNNFIPITKKEIKNLGWNYVDVVIVTGDAYVDHPSFGMAIIARVLQNEGFRVAIISMPNWRETEAFNLFGKPRLFFAVTGGNIDSLLMKYTAFKKIRNDDPYIPGGKAGTRPERAVISYCNQIKSLYKDVPIVLGGIEASMRRLAHYDYWSNKVRRSIIQDTRADILVYGMGEKSIVEIAKRIEDKTDLKGIPGTLIIDQNRPKGSLLLPSEEETLTSKEKFLELYKIVNKNTQKLLVQPTGKRYILQYPQAEIATDELDAIYTLPFNRKPHPEYKERIPAFDMIKDSIQSHRGCVSGCAFCSLGLHQGKKIVSRSENSILDEIKTISRIPGFKGHITDIGGPSANMYGFECQNNWICKRGSCLYPDLCKNLKLTTKKWVELLDKAANINGVKRVTVGSGIRYDIFHKDDPNNRLLKRLVKNHISGQMKIAPEHTAPQVLNAMHKKPLCDLNDFINAYKSAAKSVGKKEYIIPYLMSCHPGSNYKDMDKMKNTIYKLFGFVPKQVQAFIPLPMTISSVIYYTGIDPTNNKEYFSEKDPNKRRKQHNVFFQRNPKINTRKK